MPKLLVNLDLNKNQLLNAVVQNLATHPSSPKQGQIYFNTTDKVLYGFNGSGWTNMFGEGGEEYTHPSANNGPYDQTFTGATVLASFITDSEGHVDKMTTKTLTLDDLGYTPYTHPQGGSMEALSGAKVISDVEVDDQGHVTGFVTRDLTAADIGAAVINDAEANSDSTWSGSKIEQEIAAAVSGVPTPSIDSFNPATSTPDIEGDAQVQQSIKKSDFYVASAPGDFFGEALNIGDTLIAKIDNPTSIEDWIRVERNIPDIVDATKTEKGIIQISTDEEASAGENETKAINAKQLEDKFAQGIKKYSAVIGNGSATSISVNHNLGTTNVVVTVKEASTGEVVIADVTISSNNAVTIDFNNAPALNQFEVVVVG